MLAELAWVLRGRYALKAEAIASALRALLGSATIAWQSPAAVALALQLFDAQPGGEFSDCLVVAQAQTHGCEATATFDRDKQALPGVRLI